MIGGKGCRGNGRSKVNTSYIEIKIIFSFLFDYMYTFDGWSHTYGCHGNTLTASKKIRRELDSI